MARHQQCSKFQVPLSGDAPVPPQSSICAAILHHDVPQFGGPPLSPFLAPAAVKAIQPPLPMCFHLWGPSIPQSEDPFHKLDAVALGLDPAEISQPKAQVVQAKRAHRCLNGFPPSTRNILFGLVRAGAPVPFGNVITGALVPLEKFSDLVFQASEESMACKLSGFSVPAGFCGLLQSLLVQVSSQAVLATARLGDLAVPLIPPCPFPKHLLTKSSHRPSEL